MELLITIGIIAVLAAILLPALMGAMRRAEEAQARTEVHALRIATEAYLKEYGVFPGGAASADTVYTVGGGNKALVDALRGLANNPRRIVFLDVGSTNSVVNGSFRDPWERPYCAVLDADFDNDCQGGGQDVQGKNVIVWSVGRNSSSAEDDIRSW
ncbi:MAG: hypothetical protein JXB04_04360 [Kiritimatiellae bacterium]|nr:hypothetical protein [Kiritimatiellia bacterium]